MINRKANYRKLNDTKNLENTQDRNQIKTLFILKYSKPRKPALIKP